MNNSPPRLHVHEEWLGFVKTLALVLAVTIGQISIAARHLDHYSSNIGQHLFDFGAGLHLWIVASEIGLESLHLPLTAWRQEGPWLSRLAVIEARLWIDPQRIKAPDTAILLRYPVDDSTSGFVDEEWFLIVHPVKLKEPIANSTLSAATSHFNHKAFHFRY